MKQGTFFEKFELFADAPKGVRKLRELVLELAFRGRLAPQSAADSRHQAWRDVATLPEVQDGSPLDWETPFEVPESWKWTTLAHLGDTKPRNDAQDAARCSFITMSMIPERYGAPVTYEVRPWGEIKKGYTHVRNGDVVMAKITPCFQNGKSALLAELAGGFGAGTTELHVLRPRSPALIPGFALLFLKTAGYFERGIPLMTGSAGQKRVPPSYFAGSPFPLPPPAEQSRILAKVDELMAVCDRLEAQQQDRETRRATLAQASLARFADAPTPANLNFLFHDSYAIEPGDLRKSILTLAVEGKLVPQDTEDEGVHTTLAQNDVRRRDSARGDRRADADQLPLLSGNDRWAIPGTWAWRALADLVLFVDYRGKTPTKVSSGVRLLTAKNVRRGEISLSPQEFLSQKDYGKWMTRGLPREGDVLFTTEAPMGYAAVVALTEPFALAQRVICFQSYGAIDPSFLVLQILSGRFQLMLDKSGTGVTAKGIKAGKLKHLPVAVPPLAEQHRIVARVGQLTSMVGQLEGQLTSSRVAAEKLTQAVVAGLTVRS